MHNKYPRDTVVFRYWPAAIGNEVLALFPDSPWNDNPNLCGSYQHIGQGGAADYAGMIRETRPATPAEYEGLHQELTHRGYNLRVVRHNPILARIWFRKRRAHLARLSNT